MIIRIPLSFDRPFHEKGHFFANPLILFEVF
jgi:hypothetical protein